MLRMICGFYRDVYVECSLLGCIVYVRSVRRLLVAAKIVPSLPILATLMIERYVPFETSVLTIATRRNIPEDGILHGDA
jgi:hypothetical protein